MGRRGGAATLVSLIAGCGSVVGGEGSVDPSNANALSRVLDVDEARRRSGPPPSASVGPDAPSLVASSTAAVVLGRRFEVELEFIPGESGAGPRRLFFGVEGASDHFVRDAGSDLVLSVLVPSEVAEGDFQFHVCAEDEAGRVSNPVVLDIDVIPPIVQREDGFFCTTGGESSCQDRGLQFCIEPETRACFYLIGGEAVDCACPEGGPNRSCVDRIVELCAP
jgi:hypothetical protein